MSTRLSLSPNPAECFLVGRNVARVSLVWWADGEPVFVSSASSAARTVVAVWPTDSRGSLRSRDLASVEILDWWLLKRDFERIRELVAAGWDLAKHDLYVCERFVGPCQETLRAQLDGDPRVGRGIKR